MGRTRDVEDMPRLLAALGLDGPGGFDRTRVDEGRLTSPERAALEHWVPTRESLDRTMSRSVGDAAGAGESDPIPVGSGESDPTAVGRHRRAAPPVALFTVPAGLRGARRGVTFRVLAVTLVVVALASLVLGVRVVRARAVATPHPVGAGPTRPGSSAGLVPTAGPATSGIVSRSATAFPASGPPATSGAATSSGSGPLVVVHVVGQVRRPGLARLPAGSRVADAVGAAGGARPKADLAALNLARVLVDGEQIHVPKHGEVVSAAPPAAGPSGGGVGGEGSGALVNLNTADLAALDTLPGVGPVLASRILDWRTEHGRFASIDELAEVSGIGPKMLAQLTPKVTL